MTQAPVKMRIVLTGSHGFLGEQLLAYFKDLGYSVTTLRHQDFDDGFKDGRLEKADVFIHCAARVHEKVTAPYADYFRDNTLLTEKALLLAKAMACRSFLYISTVAVYGSPRNDVNYTVDTPPRPDSAYGLSKLLGEYLVSDQKEIPRTATLRIPLILDVKAPGNVHTLVSMMKRLPLLPFGKFEEPRSYVSVDCIKETLRGFCLEEARATRLHTQSLLADYPALSTASLVGILAKALALRIRLFPVPLLFFRLAALASDFFYILFGRTLPFSKEVYRKLNGKFVIIPGATSLAYPDPDTGQNHF